MFDGFDGNNDSCTGFGFTSDARIAALTSGKSLKRICHYTESCDCVRVADNVEWRCLGMRMLPLRMMLLLMSLTMPV